MSEWDKTKLRNQKAYSTAVEVSLKRLVLSAEEEVRVQKIVINALREVNKALINYIRRRK